MLYFSLSRPGGSFVVVNARTLAEVIVSRDESDDNLYENV